MTIRRSHITMQSIEYGNLVFPKQRHIQEKSPEDVQPIQLFTGLCFYCLVTRSSSALGNGGEGEND